LNPIAQTDFNLKLAAACQKKCADCCRRGRIFLPENQYQALRDWVVEKSPANCLMIFGFTTNRTAASFSMSETIAACMLKG